MWTAVNAKDQWIGTLRHARQNDPAFYFGTIGTAETEALGWTQIEVIQRFLIQSAQLGFARRI